MDEAAGGGVHEEPRAVALVGLAEHDPVTRPEARLARALPRVGGGGPPAVADGAEVHVGIEVAGGEEAVGDEVDEVPRERRPARHCRSARKPGFFGEELELDSELRGLGSPNEKN